MRTIPVPLDLMSAVFLSQEVPETYHLGSSNLHEQAVLDIEVRWSDRVRGGDENEADAVAHIALHANHARLKLVQGPVHQIGVGRVILDVQ